jgi:hypothetical protein
MKASDINDTLQREGPDAVRARSDRARKYQPTNGEQQDYADQQRRSGVDHHLDVSTPIKLIKFADIKLDNKRRYLIKGLIPRSGLTVVWGPPKCGKSFWTFDLVMHVALDWKYRGRRVHGGSVVYLALEGSEAFKARIEAFRQRHIANDAPSVPFYLVSAGINLVKDHVALIQSITANISTPAVVVIDTLNRSLAGSESDDKDMAAYIRAADAIREALGCAVIVVHHCGIDATRPRGHTSLTGAADAQLAVKRDAADNIVVTVEWMKDGPEGDQIVSLLEPIKVGLDVDGDKITSCVIVPVEGAAASAAQKGKAKRLSKGAQTALRALTEALDEVGSVPPASNHIPSNVRTVTVDQWRQYAYARGISTGEDRAKQQAFRRATEHLIADQHVGVWQGQAWTT